MPRRMFVACGATLAQRDLDEGAPEQDRGQWVFAFNGPRGWIKQLVTVAVDFLCPREDQSGGTLVGGPPHQKCECHVDIGISGHMIERPLFRIEIFKVGQSAKVCPQMGWAEMGFEECQSQSLGLVRTL